MSKAAKRDLYQEVTDQIIEALEAGVAPWVKPWDATSGLPRNGSTGRQYNGLNILLLQWAQIKNGYETAEWMTYRQAQSMGGNVRKGERSTMVTFWKFLDVDDENAPSGKKTIPMLRHFNVFNRDQIDGLPEIVADEREPHERHAEAEAVIAATGADITYGDHQACYAPFSDFVFMPALEAFDSPEAFYSTTLHELVHWTGSSKRLDRDMSGSFGDASYAGEELIAELGSAFLCAEIGISGSLRHAEYIGHWITRLKNDKRAIFSAASKAKKAATFIMNFSEAEEGEATA